MKCHNQYLMFPIAMLRESCDQSAVVGCFSIPIQVVDEILSQFDDDVGAFCTRPFCISFFLFTLNQHA